MRCHIIFHYAAFAAIYASFSDTLMLRAAAFDADRPCFAVFANARLSLSLASPYASLIFSFSDIADATPIFADFSFYFMPPARLPLSFASVFSCHYAVSPPMPVPFRFSPA
jgi:hypothetical protein